MQGFGFRVVPILTIGDILASKDGRRRPGRLAADLVRRIRQHPETTGLDVVGVCLSEMVSTWVSLGSLERVPVMGSWEDAIKAVDELDADVVAVCSHPDVSENQPLRRPGWMLEQRGVDLLVSPGIVEVAGPRLSLRPAQGLSMLHVERPLTEGLVYRAKTIVDRIMGAAVLALLAPVLVVLVSGWRARARRCSSRSGSSTGAGRSGCSSSGRWSTTPSRCCRSWRRSMTSTRCCSRCVRTRG